MIVLSIKEWHKAVCSRDDYVCQLRISPDCKKDYSFPIYFDEDGENPYVCGDHLKPRNVAPELKFETTNGKCVCKQCHALRDYRELPEGYLEPAEESISAVADQPMRITTGHEIPVNLSSFLSMICKNCKKYQAYKSGLCLQCQPWKGSNLKIKKPKKSKK